MQHSATSVDLVTYDAMADEYVLIISNTDTWEQTERENTFILSKIDNYLKFVLSGQLESLYPNAAGKKITIQIDCEALPPASSGELINRLKKITTRSGVQFRINLL